MSATSQERNTADSRNPLQHAGILQRVLDYVGPAHWCFVAEVCSLWRDLYKRVACRGMEVRTLWGMVIEMMCVPQMTMQSAVFASPSRVRHAHAHGLSYTADHDQRAAGMYADIATLEAAHDCGMPYTLAVMEGAARCNELAVVQFLRAAGCPWGRQVFERAAARGNTAMCAYLHAEHCPWSEQACIEAACYGQCSTLRWLHEHGCPWYADHIHLSAATGGSVDALVYLQQQGIVYTAEMLTDMLNAAGANNNLAAAKWLKQQGAEWPVRLCRFRQPWFDDTLVWARAEGCTSPT
jgi:hypothetical protein